MLQWVCLKSIKPQAMLMSERLAGLVQRHWMGAGQAEVNRTPSERP